MESIATFIGQNNTTTKIVVVIIGYFLTFIVTNILIKKIILKEKDSTEPNDGINGKIDQKRIKDGYIIGKCENIIIVSFILVGEVTGLALIFAPKT